MTKQKGVTLIELVVALSVLMIVLTGAVSLFNNFALNQARSIQLFQAVHISDYFLNEVMSASYSGEPQASRETFSSVDDYDHLVRNGCRQAVTEIAPCDRRGESIAYWRGYKVDILVTPERILNLDAKKIAVMVTSPAGDKTTLTGFKASAQ